MPGHDRGRHGFNHHRYRVTRVTRRTVHVSPVHARTVRYHAHDPHDHLVAVGPAAFYHRPRPHRPARQHNRRRNSPPPPRLWFGGVTVHDYGHVDSDSDSDWEDEVEAADARGPAIVNYPATVSGPEDADPRGPAIVNYPATVSGPGNFRGPAISGPPPRRSNSGYDNVSDEVLQVTGLDLLVAQNCPAHHTDEYDVTELRRPRLVVRRGQPFAVKLSFNRQYDVKKDDLRLIFEIGDQPKPSKGTHVEFILSDKDMPGEWGAAITKTTGNDVTVNVFTPPDLMVGLWDIKVDVVKKADTGTNVFRYNHKDPIYMLFNPWCKDDVVYVENEKERHAYVLEDKGKIYAGNYRRISGKPWVFGQFSGNVLDCCMYLLDRSKLNVAVRGNPVPVCRKLTAMVNGNDDGGVLAGKWGSPYKPDKSPLAWTGSAPILEQYYATKFTVNYGQCWVFSGVLTTVLRALGIPARSVTNFASAHDVDSSITIDYHYDEDGEPLGRAGGDEDSVWNFHVWNEAWFARPDLPQGYGGWQAMDATPQEVSDGVFCCGPVPVQAIKQGEVNLPYDGPFVFAEVNADKVHWVIGRDGSMRPAHREKNAIGKFISTFSTRGDREDVTNRYKFPENSAEERTAVLRANKTGSKARDNAYSTGPEDMSFDVDFDSENSYVGHEFVVELKCKNNSKETRHVGGLISASTMYYTGVVADPVGREAFQGVPVKAGETKEIVLKIAAEKYADKLKDCCMVAVSVMVRVVETKQVFAKKDDMRLRKPHLVVKGPSDGSVGKEIELNVSFTNPTTQTLTDCSLVVEAPGITQHAEWPQGDVSARGTFMATIKLKPKKAGSRHIVVIFNSQQLEDVNGTHDINVKK